MSSCDQFREMYEAYVLDALDASERAALDAHLATGCAECAKAVAEARWLVSQLAYTAPDAGPSDMLKGRLMQTVRAEARSASTARSATPGVPYWLSAGIAALLLITFYSAWTAYRAKEDLRAANERVDRSHARTTRRRAARSCRHGRAIDCRAPRKCHLDRSFGGKNHAHAAKDSGSPSW